MKKNIKRRKKKTYRKSAPKAPFPKELATTKSLAENGMGAKNPMKPILTLTHGFIETEKRTHMAVRRARRL